MFSEAKVHRNKQDIDRIIKVEPIIEI